jgi:Fumarate reductase flavoprotein C-term
LELGSHRDVGDAQFTYLSGADCEERSGSKEIRGSHAREDYQERDDQNFMEHSLSWQRDVGENVDIGYRSVQFRNPGREPMQERASEEEELPNLAATAWTNRASLPIWTIGVRDAFKSEEGLWSVCSSAEWRPACTEAATCLL